MVAIAFLVLVGVLAVPLQLVEDIPVTTDQVVVAPPEPATSTATTTVTETKDQKEQPSSER